MSTASAEIRHGLDDVEQLGEADHGVAADVGTGSGIVPGAGDPETSNPARTWRARTASARSAVQEASRSPLGGTSSTLMVALAYPLVIGCGCRPVRGPEGDLVALPSLAVCGTPGKDAGGRVEARPLGQAGGIVGQGVPVRVGGRDREAEELSFAHGLGYGCGAEDGRGVRQGETEPAVAVDVVLPGGSRGPRTAKTPGARPGPCWGGAT